MGLSLKRMTREFDDGQNRQVVFDYYSLTSDRLLLPEPVVAPIADAFGSDKVAVACTYLANAIERVDEKGDVVASVPYSTITAIDSSEDLPLPYDRLSQRQLGDRVPLVINDWAARQLDADVATPLRVAYYLPEVENGNEVEQYFDAVVAAIVPITKPSRPYRGRREAVLISRRRSTTTRS